LGCATGGYTFELARHSQWAVGIDFNFSLVSAAALIQREQSIRFMRKRRCRHADATEYRFDLPKNVFFMVADALEPPFSAEIFDFVSALNLLDNVRFPLIRTKRIICMPAPQKAMLTQLAKVNFASKAISLPTNWSDLGSQYPDAFSPSERMAPPNPPMTLFREATLNKYHVDSCFLYRKI
jgi:SAM-dependent methyltransferase